MHNVPRVRLGVLGTESIVDGESRAGRFALFRFARFIAGRTGSFYRRSHGRGKFVGQLCVFAGEGGLSCDGAIAHGWRGEVLVIDGAENVANSLY